MTDTTAPAAPAKKLFAGFSLRRFLGWLHLWTGIIFCIPFALLGLSGSALMLGHDLPNDFAENAAASTYKPIAEIIAAAQAVAPEGRIPAGYDAPEHASDPAVVRFSAPRREGQAPAGPPQRGQTRVTVDPVSLEAKAPQPPAQGAQQGAQQSFNFMRLMHDMHGRMLINGGPGRQFVGWLGVFMCGLGLSGIVMWWPRKGQWKRAFSVRLRQAPLMVNRDLHGAVGIWGLIVFLIVSFSGVYIVWPQPINGMFGASAVVRDLRNQQPFPVTPVESVTPLDVDSAAALAKEVVQGGVVRAVTLPQNPEQPYRVALSRIGDGDGAPRATVIIDPWQKKVMQVRDPAAYAAGDKFLAWQRAMHAGNGLGWVWWILVFISGLLPALFVGTGITMYLLKRRNKALVKARAAAQA